MWSKGEDAVHPFDFGGIGACLLVLWAQGVHWSHSFPHSLKGTVFVAVKAMLLVVPSCMCGLGNDGLQGSPALGRRTRSLAREAAPGPAGATGMRAGSQEKTQVPRC